MKKNGKKYVLEEKDKTRIMKLIKIAICLTLKIDYDI